MNKKTIRDIEWQGKRALVRVDFNVPIKDGAITDDTRIKGALDTIKYLVQNQAKVILCSHLGRPNGEFNLKYTLKPVAEKLASFVNTKVTFANDAVGESAKEAVENCKDGEIVLLENVRFYPGEEKNDRVFAKELARFGDVYVNDAFGAAHRAHASTEGVVKYGFIKEGVAGFLMEKEIEMLGNAINNPKRPLIAILGGAKVSDKIKVIENLLDKCDSIIIGGGMAYTFMKTLNISIGDSLCEEDKMDLAKKLLKKAKEKNVKFLLPIDSVCADKFDNDANRQVVQAIPDGWMGLDIGPKTREMYREEILKGKTIIWNGPMGVFEMPNFAAGTQYIAESLVLTEEAATIVGGGDSVAAINKMGYANKVSHVSTGGGASLEFLEGKVLPGVECLSNKK